MTEITAYPPGTFCWVDLASPDPGFAKSFYGAVLGWTAEDPYTDLGVPYTLLSYHGMHAGGIHPLSPGQGPTPYWLSYLSVRDVDATAERAVALGATIVMPAMDVMGEGRMCVIQDPTGAPVGFWQARAHPGAQIDNQVGARSWDELLTRDTERAAAFYGALLGWTTRTSPELMEGRYVLFELEGRPVGGMLEVQADWGPMTPNWTVYFGVADCDVALETATRS